MSSIFRCRKAVIFIYLPLSSKHAEVELEELGMLEEVRVVKPNAGRHIGDFTGETSTPLQVG